MRMLLSNRFGRRHHQSLGSTYNNTSIVYAPDNGRSCACCLWERNSFRVESRIAVVVGEVEARHGERGGSAARK